MHRSSVIRQSYNQPLELFVVRWKSTVVHNVSVTLYEKFRPCLMISLSAQPGTKTISRTHRLPLRTNAMYTTKVDRHHHNGYQKLELTLGPANGGNVHILTIASLATLAYKIINPCRQYLVRPVSRGFSSLPHFTNDNARQQHPQRLLKQTVHIECSLASAKLGCQDCNAA